MTKQTSVSLEERLTIWSQAQPVTSVVMEANWTNVRLHWNCHATDGNADPEANQRILQGQGDTLTHVRARAHRLCSVTEAELCQWHKMLTMGPYPIPVPPGTPTTNMPLGKYR